MQSTATILLHWLSWGCMDECCQGFSAGKLLAASWLQCVNCRLNPNQKPFALTLCSKPVFPNLWQMYPKGTFPIWRGRPRLLENCNKLTLGHKSGIYLCSSKNPKVMIKNQWIFLILLSLFIRRNFRGTCSSVEILKGYIVRHTLGTTALNCCISVL